MEWTGSDLHREAERQPMRDRDQCCQIGVDFPPPIHSGNHGLQHGVPDWADNLAQSGNADRDFVDCDTGAYGEPPDAVGTPELRVGKC